MIGWGFQNHGDLPTVAQMNIGMQMHYSKLHNNGTGIEK